MKTMNLSLLWKILHQRQAMPSRAPTTTETATSGQVAWEIWESRDSGPYLARIFRRTSIKKQSDRGYLRLQQGVYSVM